MNIEKRVLHVITEHMGMPEGEVKLTDCFVDDIVCDSLDAIEMVMAMEEEFEIQIDESKCEAWNFKVSDAIALIESMN